MESKEETKDSRLKFDEQKAYSHGLRTINEFISKPDVMHQPDFFETVDSYLKLSNEEIDMSVLDNLEEIGEKQLETIATVLQSIDSVAKIHISNLISSKSMTSSTVYKLLIYLDNFVPKWISAINERAPPMVGAVPPSPDHKIKPGDYVAAFVLTVCAEISPDILGVPGSWILAVVIECKGSKSIVALKQGGRSTNFTVRTKTLIPLPYFKANPKTNPEAFFPKGAIVLALKENTARDKTVNCFFPALVLDIPQTSEGTYTVRFKTSKNEFGPKMNVPQLYMIEYREASSNLTSREQKLLTEKYKKRFCPNLPQESKKGKKNSTKTE